MNNMTTPEELKTIQEQIDAGRNTLTLIDQDQIRLTKLRIAEEYSIGELVKQKDALTKDIDSLEKNKENVIRETTELESKRDAVKEEIVSKSAELEDIRAESLISKDSNEKEAKDLKDLGDHIAKMNTSLSSAKNEITEREKIVSKKEENIKAFKESL